MSNTNSSYETGSIGYWAKQVEDDIDYAVLVPSKKPKVILNVVSTLEHAGKFNLAFSFAKKIIETKGELTFEDYLNVAI